MDSRTCGDCGVNDVPAVFVIIEMSPFLDSSLVALYTVVRFIPVADDMSFGDAVPESSSHTYMAASVFVSPTVTRSCSNMC